ncbi:MAG: sugar transferase, partial [Patescibacteria group bacterium]|nr:sugar transferase [Patescibacteria group bacterium]
KRIADIIFSLIFIIVFSPIYLIVALLIKFDSRGPIIYCNERVGENGKVFNLYKFRSMKIEYCIGDGYGGNKALKIESKLIKEKSQRNGPVYKVLEDPRRTKLGKIIERTSLDEIPQFFNVLLGQISVVGPRPHQPREVAKYQSWQRKVLRIKPGITGMAQISGRSDLDFDEEARLDIYYIENWSLWLDAKIVLKTPAAIFKPRKSV